MEGSKKRERQAVHARAADAKKARGDSSELTAAEKERAEVAAGVGHESAESSSSQRVKKEKLSESPVRKLSIESLGPSPQLEAAANREELPQAQDALDPLPEAAGSPSPSPEPAQNPQQENDDDKKSYHGDAEI